MVAIKMRILKDGEKTLMKKWNLIDRIQFWDGVYKKELPATNYLMNILYEIMQEFKKSIV